MIKWIGKSTIELRVATEDEADELHKQMIQETAERGWILSSWSENKKEKKIKGEVEETWIVIKYVITFSDLKEPCIILNDIEYNVSDGYYESEEF